MRRSRFCASLLDRRQCELAELDRSVVSLDHDRTRLGLVRIAGDRRQSLDLFAVDESFPVQHYRDVAPDQPDVVGLPLARRKQRTIGNIKGRSLAVDGSGLIGRNPRPLRQRPLAPPPNRTPVIMAQRRRACARACLCRPVQPRRQSAIGTNGSQGIRRVAKLVAVPRDEPAAMALDCSSRKESRTTEIDSIEPPQRHHSSTTWRRPRVLMKRW